jgi:hypothetical protein
MRISDLLNNLSPKIITSINVINIVSTFLIPLLILSKLKNNPTIVALGLIIILLSVTSIYVALEYNRFLPVINIIQMVFVLSLVLYTANSVHKDEKDRLKIKNNLIICYVLLAYIILNGIFSGLQIYNKNPFKYVPLETPKKSPDIIIDIDFK